MDNMIFDYRAFGEDMNIPAEIIQLFEKEAYDEFPNDNMLMENHILRAVKAYVKSNSRITVCEN